MGSRGHLKITGGIDRDTGRWRFFVEAMEAVGLEEALGLATGPGQRKAATIASIASRDELLRAAAAEFFPDLRPAEQARDMHQHWRRYVAAGWPRERALEEPPERRRGTIEGALWRVMKTRDHLLAERSLRLILAVSSGYLLPPPPATFDDDET